MNGDSPIYEIYVMSEPWHLGEDGWPTCGSQKRVGFYHERETAIKAIEENWCDLQDYYAKAAEMRTVMPGLYSFPSQHVCLYYEWNQEKECFENKPFPKLGHGWDEELNK